MVETQVAKSKQAEIVQWENRVEYLKAEHASLMKQKEMIQQTIDAKTAEYQIYIGSREKDVRDRSEKLAQDQKLFESQQEEFKALLSSHQLEKNSLIADRFNFEKEKQAFSGKQQGVNDFVQAVRRAYNVLPD